MKRGGCGAATGVLGGGAVEGDAGVGASSILLIMAAGQNREGRDGRRRRGGRGEKGTLGGGKGEAEGAL